MLLLLVSSVDRRVQGRLEVLGHLLLVEFLLHSINYCHNPTNVLVKYVPFLQALVSNVLLGLIRYTRSEVVLHHYRVVRDIVHHLVLSIVITVAAAIMERRLGLDQPLSRRIRLAFGILACV